MRGSPVSPIGKCLETGFCLRAFFGIDQSSGHNITGRRAVSFWRLDRCGVLSLGCPHDLNQGGARTDRTPGQKGDREQAGAPVDKSDHANQFHTILSLSMSLDLSLKSTIRGHHTVVESNRRRPDVVP